MGGYNHLHKVVHDDVKDMEMLCDYAEDALERGDKQLAVHFIDRAMQRKHCLGESLRVMEAHTEHHTEREKMLHNCTIERLDEDVEEVEEKIRELRRKL